MKTIFRCLSVTCFVVYAGSVTCWILPAMDLKYLWEAPWELTAVLFSPVVLTAGMYSWDACEEKKARGK